MNVSRTGSYSVSLAISYPASPALSLGFQQLMAGKSSKRLGQISVLDTIGIWAG